MPKITIVPCSVGNFDMADILLTAMGMKLKTLPEKKIDGIAVYGFLGQDVGLQLRYINGPMHIEVPEPREAVNGLKKLSGDRGSIKMIGSETWELLLPGIHQTLIISREHRACESENF